MEEIIRIFIGILVLALGFPIGNFLSKSTKEELRKGQNWFKAIIYVSLILAVVFLFLRIDYLLFTFAFIAIVTSRSLLKGKK